MPRNATPRSLPADRLHFAEVLSEAIARRNLTLERISVKLREAGTPVSIATLSYWQTGRSMPTRTKSLLAVEELEKLLRVPVGHLTSALPRDVVSRWEPVTQAPDADRGDLVLQQMGIDTVHHFSTDWVQDHVVITPDRNEQQESTRQLITATRDGMDRIPLVFRQTAEAEAPVWIQATAGCEAGRVVHLEEHALIAAELLLPRPLARNDLWMFEYSVAWDISTETEHGFARVLNNPVRYHVLQVVFQCPPPASAQYLTAPRHFDGIDMETALRQEVTPGPFLQMALAEPTPGMHGLAWTF